MTPRRLLGSPNDVRMLAEILSRCTKVASFDADDEPQAWTLAYTFSELEKSFRKFLDAQLPVLIRGDLGESELCELLVEIGEEFRHILYHVKEPRFYRYVHREGDSEV